jgi:predicted secreted protein
MPIELGVGEEYVLRLPGLGSAGYEWSCDVIGDEGVVGISRETPAGPSVPAPGGLPPSNFNVDEALVVKARKPGQVRLHLTLRRPWERDAAPQDERFVDAIVR